MSKKLLLRVPRLGDQVEFNWLRNKIPVKLLLCYSRPSLEEIKKF